MKKGIKKIFKKNQIIITALALLIAISGYINYMGTIGIKTKQAGSSNADVSDNEIIEPGDAVFTSSGNIISKASDIRLSKEQTRARDLEALYTIVNNEKLSDAEKSSALASVNRLVEISEKELAVEIMLEGKGFENVIASINDNAIDIMLSIENVDDVKRAQIEDMVVRKTGISVDNIVITPLQ